MSARHEEEVAGTPAGRAAEYALRVILRALRLIMAALVVAFFLSGLFFVEEGSVALRVRLGRPVGGVVGPGGPYFAWPAPVDEVLRFPTALNEAALDVSFWWPEDMPAFAVRSEPGWDVALLTADKNIVHARWSAVYRLSRDGDDAVFRFARNLGDMETAGRAVRYALERAVIHVLAQTLIERFYAGEIDVNRVRTLAQDELDAMESGLELVSVALNDRSVPLGVVNDFEAVSRAESERARRIERAGQFRTALLSDVAGVGHAELLQALEAYEQARRMQAAPDVLESLRERVDDLLLDDRLGGVAADIIQQALTERTRTVELSRAFAQRFEAMIEQYEMIPGFFRERQVQETLERIFRGSVESFHLPADENKLIYLEIGRN